MLQKEAGRGQAAFLHDRRVPDPVGAKRNYRDSLRLQQTVGHVLNTAEIERRQELARLELIDALGIQRAKAFIEDCSGSRRR